LGNIAGDSIYHRDICLEIGAMKALVELARNATIAIALRRNIVWAISNLCRFKPQPRFNSDRPAIPCLSELLRLEDDVEVLVDACWALSCLTDGANYKIQAVVEANVAPRLVELILHNSHSVVTPALQTLNNIVSGDDSQTQIVINANAIPALYALMTHSKASIREHSCFALSNIAAGNPSQIQSMVDFDGLMEKFIAILTSANFVVKKQALFSISNMTSRGTKAHIELLVQRGCIPPLCEMISEGTESSINSAAVEGLQNILRSADQGDDSYANAVEECGGVDKLKEVQNLDDGNRAASVLARFFEAYVSDDDL